jgi:hyperpolarization activated cyclic nucleotide-gated potassium channel 1
MYEDLFKGIDFFMRHKRRNFLANIGPLLKQVKFGRNEYVFTEGEYANEMYFIKSGSVSLVLKEFNNFPFLSITEGYYFGEVDLLFGETRKFSIMSENDCELLTLRKKEFFKIFFHEFRDIGSEIYNHALKRKLRALKAYREAENFCETENKIARNKSQGRRKDKYQRKMSLAQMANPQRLGMHSERNPKDRKRTKPIKIPGQNVDDVSESPLMKQIQEKKKLAKWKKETEETKEEDIPGSDSDAPPTKNNLKIPLKNKGSDSSKSASEKEQEHTSLSSNEEKKESKKKKDSPTANLMTQLHPALLEAMQNRVTDPKTPSSQAKRGSLLLAQRKSFMVNNPEMLKERINGVENSLKEIIQIFGELGVKQEPAAETGFKKIAAAISTATKFKPRRSVQLSPTPKDSLFQPISHADLDKAS